MRKILRTTKSVVACAGAAAVLTAGAVATGIVVSTSAEADPGNVRATGGLNVRSGPSMDHRVLGGLPNGAPIDTTGPSKNGFVPIKFGDREGWVSARYIDDRGVGSAPGNAAAPSKGEAYAVTETYVRTGATINYRAAGMLFKGERIELTGVRSGQYSQVNYRGAKRWAATQYLSTNWASRPAPAKPERPKDPEPERPKDPAKPKPERPKDSAKPKPPRPSEPVKPKPERPTEPAEPRPSLPKVTSQARATADLMIRSSATKPFEVIAEVPAGTELNLTGVFENGMAQIVYRDRVRWVNAKYLKGPGVAAPEGSELPKTVGTRYATTALNIRTGPEKDARTVTEVPRGTELKITGKNREGRAEIVYRGAVRWVTAKYLSKDRPKDPEPSGGGIKLPGLHPNAARALADLQREFPQIKTVYGKRNDPGSDHKTGRALDVMLPDYKSNRALGDRIASWGRSNAGKYQLDYVIFNQRIWSVARAGEGWRRMADRGSDTQNHIDHVHLSFRNTSSKALPDTGRTPDRTADKRDDGPAAKTQSCKASFYSDPQPTASGERFDPGAMTAAHKSLPFGTRVRVTNPKNNKSVEVRINDRGPYISGRCLDLSKAAFAKIGSVDAGVLSVDWRVL